MSNNEFDIGVIGGGSTRELKAESILVSMGRAPNVEGLGLDEIGIKYDRSGILVDKRLCTNFKHIYAAGDVNGGFQFTHAAAIHPYPTMGEINKRVAGAYLSPKIFSKTIQKGLKFFFNLKGRACNLDNS